MTFENLAKLTNSTLLNEPCISSFERIVFDPIRVKRGDLFIGNDIQDIKIALKRDAYAIMSDKHTNILDDEIAWLKCESINEALKGLLRYSLMQTKLHFVCFDPVEAALMKKITSKESIIFLNTDPKKNFQKIIDAPENSLIISGDKEYLQDIYPAYELANIPILHSILKIKSTLFLSSFVYKNVLYENIKLPEIFLKKFENIVNFLDSKSIDYRIDRCDFTPYFYPLFINGDLVRKSFGSTQKALIIISDDKNLNDFINYLQHKASWAKHILFLPRKIKTNNSNKIKTISYINLTEITKLKELEFNFAIIKANPQDMAEVLKKIETKKEPSLFEE